MVKAPAPSLHFEPWEDRRCDGPAPHRENGETAFNSYQAMTPPADLFPTPK